MFHYSSLQMQSQLQQELNLCICCDVSGVVGFPPKSYSSLAQPVFVVIYGNEFRIDRPPSSIIYKLLPIGHLLSKSDPLAAQSSQSFVAASSLLVLFCGHNRLVLLLEIDLPIISRCTKILVENV